MRPDEYHARLTPLEWLEKAWNLPIKEAARRLYGLTTAIPRDVLAIHRHQSIARKRGKSLHLVVLSGNLGDIVAAEPTLHKIKKSDDYVVWLSRYSYTGLLDFNPNVDAVLPVDSITETLILRRLLSHLRWTYLYVDGAVCSKFGFPVKNPNPAGVDDSNFYFRGTLADVYCLIGSGEKANAQPIVYPDPSFDAQAFLSEIFENPEKPLLLLHITSDEAIRGWSTEPAQQTAEWVLAHSEFNIVELGLEPLLRKSSRTHLLRGGLPLSRQLALFRTAKIFIGVDSGFLHVANAMRVDSVVLLGHYRKFTNYLPCLPNDGDVVIRGAKHSTTIGSEEVIRALGAIMARQGTAPLTDSHDAANAAWTGRVAV